MIHFQLHGLGHLSLRCGVAAVAVTAGACSHSPKSPADAPAPSQRAPTASSTTSLDTAVLKTDRAQSVEELIQGRFAGVQVVRLAGGGFSLRIRGAGSLVGSNEPLYVVDGTALPPAPGGALVGVDPRDIERIDVLKDISATSSYGVRGANGVILIKTKRGR